jgi:hypothetical protein
MTSRSFAAPISSVQEETEAFVPRVSPSDSRFGERDRFVQLYSNIEPVGPRLVAFALRDASTHALTQVARSK